MKVVYWLMRLVEMKKKKRVAVRHKPKDDERVRKGGEVHQDSVVFVVVTVDDDC